MKNAFVTGGNGYIGIHICLVLIQKGFNVFTLDSLVNSRKDSLNEINKIIGSEQNFSDIGLHIYFGDLRDKKIIEKIFVDAEDLGKPIDFVMHLAGLKSVEDSCNDSISYWDTNVVSSINLLSIMEKHNCNQFIFSSSATIYAPNEDDYLREQSIISPYNTYGKTKLVIENILKDIFERHNGKWKIANLRYFNPIGAHNSGIIGENPKLISRNIFPQLCEVALGKKDFLDIYGKDWPTKDGTCVRDYIHVMDIAEGYLKVLEHLTSNSPQVLNLNLGSGKGTTVLELIKTFEEVNKVTIPFKIKGRRKGDVPRLVADNNLAKRTINWEPKRSLKQMCIDGLLYMRKIHAI